MYKELLEALTTKFQGVSETVLSRIAHKHEDAAKTLEDVKTITEGVTIQQIIDGEADRRATEASTTAVKNYKKKLAAAEDAQPQAAANAADREENAAGATDSARAEQPSKAEKGAEPPSASAETSRRTTDSIISPEHMI